MEKYGNGTIQALAFLLVIIVIAVVVAIKSGATSLPEEVSGVKSTIKKEVKVVAPVKRGPRTYSEAFSNTYKKNQN